MKAHQAIHPSRDDLKAFGLGKLDQTAADTVIDHLETCEECRGVVAESSGDSFLNRLRSARTSDKTAIPNKSTSGLGRTLNSPTSSTTSALPTELSSRIQGCAGTRAGLGYDQGQARQGEGTHPSSVAA